MLTKVIPVTIRITEDNLPFDKVSYIRYGIIGFKKHSDSQKFSFEEPAGCQHSRQMGYEELISE
jgi:hypothetical protein